MLRIDNVNIQSADLSVEIFNSLNFELIQGEYVCIRSGSQDGASSLLETMAGLKTPSSGQVSLDDKPLDDYSDRDIFQSICMCHEHNGLVSFFSNKENIVYPVRYHQLINDDILEERLSRYAEHLGVSELLAFEPWQLNDVQYRLMNLLRALVIEPKVILLDEFQSGMSDEMVERLTSYLKALCTTNLAIVEVVTAGDETGHADRIFRIKDNTLELES